MVTDAAISADWIFGSVKSIYFLCSIRILFKRTALAVFKDGRSILRIESVHEIDPQIFASCALAR
jgi:hypothetical protein